MTVGNHSNASKNHRREDNPDANQVGWGNHFLLSPEIDPFVSIKCTMQHASRCTTRLAHAQQLQPLARLRFLL
ncbi:hypothetical protein I308_100319 [Cryptococcus tetragattii IND107]|uniref:Uncharacterized protein n=1 Tax=Cryptococcus tetragattii IND107 TaxID=1296105 RepID=A0ABR3C4G0_9TREE